MSTAEGGSENRRDPAASIDWEVAAGVGRRLARGGPAMTSYTRDQVHAELADASKRAEAPVRGDGVGRRAGRAGLPHCRPRGVGQRCR